MIGWIAILVHFTASLLASFSFLSPALDDWMWGVTLEVAGISFLLSVSRACATAKRRTVFLALIGGPSLIYTTCWVFQIKYGWIYQGIVALAIFTAVALSISFYDRKKPSLYVICFVFAAPGLWVLREIAKNNVTGVVFFLAEYFAITGLLYWRRFHRFTPGVITTSLSFVAWGAIFPAGQILTAYQVAIPPDNSVFWDLPKYFVAFGMILTLFENQTKIATRVAKQYQVLFEGNLAAVYVSTFQGKLLDCNSAFVNMYGFASKEDALGRATVSLYRDPADREAFLTRIKRDGQVLNYEVQQRKKDRTLFWILERATIVTEVSGENVIEGTAIDITERKQAEMDLKQSEERFAAIFRHSPVGCAIISPEGVLLNVNEQGLKLIGLPAEKVIGKTTVELGFLSQSARDSLYQKLQADGSVQNVEIEFKDVFGNQHVGLYFATLVRIGNMECNFGMFLDCTEERELEAKFRQAQKMEALGRLAGGVAHDFNNLLGVIGGYAELLEVKLGRDENYKRYCTKIIDTTQRASGLTRQLLTFSRKEITRPGPLKPDHALRELASMLSRLIGEDIEMNLDLRAKGTVVIDKTHFEQIIFNIVVNARDAMPSGGQLFVETEDIVRPAPVSSDNVPSSQYVAIRIHDTGIGMDEQTRLHAFEPFFTTKGMGRGTGLGLSTVYGIVQQCDGEITIDSQPGKGTTISILLPAALNVETTEEQTTASKLTNGTGNILLVEDELELRDANAEFLTSMGYSVICASSGPEALQLASQVDQLDLVISDVVMPKMNGREFVDRLVTLRPNTKILFVSGYADDVVLQAGITNLGTPYLQKPFSLKQLGNRVQELMSIQSPADDAQPAKIIKSEL
jgi:PAS domain S-box-containing protein